MTEGKIKQGNAQAVIDGDTVYTSAKGQVRAVDKQTGALKWTSKDFGGAPFGRDVFVALVTKERINLGDKVEYTWGEVFQRLNLRGLQQAIGAAAPPEPLRVLMLVTNDAGKLLDKCSFAILKPGVVPVKGEIKREDILLLGRTNESGYFDSAEKGTNLKSGSYPVKIVREGYESFVSTMEVRQGSVLGYAVLAVRLKAE